jgi:hypothetical protein
MVDRADAQAIPGAGRPARRPMTEGRALLAESRSMLAGRIRPRADPFERLQGIRIDQSLKFSGRPT